LHQEDNVKIFVNGLLLHPIIQKLKLVDDKGISVSAHTYDVLQVAIKLIKKKYRSLEEAQEELDFFSIVAGDVL
jgi:carbonic anhydrase